jgi:hypothetical protein
MLCRGPEWWLTFTITVYDTLLLATYHSKSSYKINVWVKLDSPQHSPRRKKVSK